MVSTLAKKEDRFTYEDYRTWDDDFRCELIDGLVYALAAPSPLHQSISGNLFRQFDAFLKNNPCKIYYAPLDVRLNVDSRDDTVVQPDLLVVCDKSKIDVRGCNGAPDFVIEILSPSTVRMDLLTKYNQYLNAGVREYWVVDPENRIVHVFVLKEGCYTAKIYGDTDTVASHVLGGCKVNLIEIFEPGD